MSIGRQIMALLAVGWSPVRGLSVVPAPQPQQIEDRFMVGAVALAPVSLEDAASAVRRLGVARVDGMVDPTLAAALKQRTIDEMLRRSDRWVEPDDRMVPGTRLRFREAIEIEFDNGGRSDILMPLEDELVDSALRQALQKLAPVLTAAARCLPCDEDETLGPNEPSSSSAGPDGLDGPIDLELIECAVLWSRPGSTHQSLHADFLRRDRSLGEELGEEDGGEEEGGAGEGEAVYGITDDEGNPMSLQEVERQLEGCGVAELREMCSEMSQPTAGGKAALVERILTTLRAAGEEEEEEAEEEEDGGDDDDDDNGGGSGLELYPNLELLGAGLEEEAEEESPFDWDAMSAADDDDDEDGGDYDMPPRLVTFVYLQDCPANPNPDHDPDPDL